LDAEVHDQKGVHKVGLVRRAPNRGRKRKRKWREQFQQKRWKSGTDLRGGEGQKKKAKGEHKPPGKTHAAGPKNQKQESWRKGCRGK